MAITNKLHHYLTCQEITFLDKNNDMGVARVNTMIQSETKNLTVKHLARGQQAAQAQLHDKLGYVAQVVNAIFLNMNYIGLMTLDEFQQTGAYGEAAGNA